MIGQTISHYKILEKLGEGGMGIVYKAEDTKLKRVVGIKFLPKRLSVHGEERERFVHEAQAASSLNHPSICTIHEIDEVNGETFIVMEYVEGTTLREWIRRKLEQSDGYRKLGIKESVAIAIQIAEGLEKAHEKGIVHRDIKTENIMVTADGRAKIMDFGLAKLHGVSKITKTGSTVGTVAYMSPEQVEGIETDHRTDIFSYGVVLYEMLTGKLPFQAAHEAALMYEIINVHPPALSSVRQGADEELNRVVMKCLEKDREVRYQTMKDVAVDLKRHQRDSAGKKIDRPAVSHDSQDKTAPVKGTNVRWMLFGAVAIAVLMLGVSAWYLFGTKSAPLDSLAVLPFSDATTDPNTEYLTEGITDNIINKLSQLSKLRVMPRSMVEKYKGKGIDPREVGKDLNVSAILTGKIRQRGDELTIQTELIDIQNVSQLWGEQYNKRISDVVEVQQDIAQKVAEKLHTQLSGEERDVFTTTTTVNSEAYQLYLKGLFYLNKRTLEGSHKGIEFFEKAVATDKNFPLAYTGLAEAYFIGSYYDIPLNEAMPKVKENARRALALDPKLAEAYTILAEVKAYHDYDFSGAEESYRRAIELNPKYARVRHWFGEYLIFLGRFEEGAAEYQRALELDPASLVIMSDAGAGYYIMRQYDRSIEVLKKTIDMDPNFERSHFYIMGPYRAKGMDDEAFKELIIGMRVSGSPESRIDAVKKAYASSGFKGVAQLKITYWKQHPEDSSMIPDVYDYIMAGDNERSLEELERLYENRSGICPTIKTDPHFDGLRNEPRFIALMKKMGFEK